MKTHSATTIALLGGGLLLCSIAALIGVACLIFGIDVLAGSLGGFIDSYVWGMIFWAFVFGLGILIPGIVGIVLCVRRLKVLLGRRPGRGLAYLLLGPAALCVLVGIALMMKPISGGHLQLQLLAGKRSFADLKLEGAELIGVNLGRANLRGAALWNAILPRADLSDADLSGTNLSDADLKDANLSGANLQGANLARASL